MRKSCIIISTVILFSICLLGCNSIENKKQVPTSVAKNLEFNDISVSITLSKKDDNDPKFRNGVLNMNTNKITFSDEIPRNSQYSLSVYDPYDDCIYYSSRADEITHCDNLFVYDKKTKKTTQLTDNIFAINFIIPQKDTILLIAHKQNENYLLMTSYDKKTKILTDISFPNKETNPNEVWYVNTNPHTGEMIIKLYNSDVLAEATKKWNAQDESLKTKGVQIKNYVYSYIDGKITLLFTEDMTQCDYLVANEHTVIYGKDNIYKSHKIYKFDRNTKKHTEITIDKPFSDFFYLSKAGDKLYFISNNTLYYMDFNTMEISEDLVFDNLQGKDLYINNYMLFKK